MISFVWISLLSLSLFCFVIRFIGSKSERIDSSNNNYFTHFQRSYLIVYLLATLSDWLQGPYNYALYASKGLSEDDVATLFILGFLSSLIFGTIAGSLADTQGRKRMSIFFGVFFSLNCLCRISNNFLILCIGRIFSGIATSLLFTVFEAWMIHEHHQRMYDEALLANTFSLASFGNSIVACVSGIISSFSVSYSGLLAPYMISMILSLITLVYVMINWTENYGDIKVSAFSNARKAINQIKENGNILKIGLVQCLFETPMYVFVYLWTPTLEKSKHKDFESSIIHGLIFSCFMVAIMLGSSIFSRLIKYFRVELISTLNLIIASIAMIIPVFSSNVYIIFISFIVFEICCGIHFPSLGTQRNDILPDETRSTIMSLFRVGLNIFVVILLKMVSVISTSDMFFICTISLAIASLLQYLLFKSIKPVIID